MDLFITLAHWVLSIAIGTIVAMHLLLPLLVWKQQGVPADYQLEKLPPEPFLAERNAEFRLWHRDLLLLGFEHLGVAELVLSHAKTRCSLYRHDNGFIATVLTAGNAHMEGNMLEFTQPYADGSVFSVHNAIMPAVYPDLPYKQAVRLPGIRDANALLQAALQLRKQQGGIPACLAPDAVFQYAGDFLDREHQDLIRLGYFTSKRRPDGLRGLTLKGAYLMTWKLLWPTRLWLDAQQRRAGVKALRAAG
jgi:hypothetical protein